MTVTLEARLARIRVPNQQNQKQVAVVLAAVEDTLREQGTQDFTATAYFAVLLSLLPQSISPAGIVDKNLASSTVYLLDIVTPFTPAGLLRTKFAQILLHLVPALTRPEAEAPLLRSAIGCLESLLIGQDSSAWQMSRDDIGPRRGLLGLLNIALDDRPKVRKRAQEAITKVLRTPPPSPSIGHPAGEICATHALQFVIDIAKKSDQKHGTHDPRLIHALQLVRAVAGGIPWPLQRIEPLVETLLNISRSNNEFLTMAAFDVFEMMFATLTDELTSVKLYQIIEAISELRPARSDSTLLPPWLAVVSRAYEVYAVVEPESAFQEVPGLFDSVSSFLDSPSHDIRTSASHCLVSIVVNCIPDQIILGPERHELSQIAVTATNLLSLRFQEAWNEVFDILKCLFDKFRWKAIPLLVEVVRTVGDLRSNEGFQGRKQADEVLGHAIRAMGPDTVLKIVPLNLAKPKVGQPGRAWLLPILRDYTENTKLSHFISEFVPLSKLMYQRILDHMDAEKTMEVAVYETIIQQIWSTLPGYCSAPLDLKESFDQPFAELLANVLYERVELRPDICRALENLVETNKQILEPEAVNGEEDLIKQHRISKIRAQENINFMTSFAKNLLLVLFNVYGQTLPQSRGYMLKCINSYLSISPAQELVNTFAQVTNLLEQSLSEAVSTSQVERERKRKDDPLPPTEHTLLDLVITIAPYLPPESHNALLSIFAIVINKNVEPGLQKKAYKIIPRIAESENGKKVLSDRIGDLQRVIIESANNASSPCRRDRLEAIIRIVDFLPPSDFHFISVILPEVIISTKEVNEKARSTAFDLLVSIGERMKTGGTVMRSKLPGQPENAPSVEATLEEYCLMVAGGLVGATPHMVSAAITALTRILYQFKDELATPVLEELVTTMVEEFLESKNREIVRSVLGFVKVCVISLAKELVVPKLEKMIPNLLVWSHEHKAHFKVKVKHIIERMIRRFGYELVEKYVPEDDKKLVINIRKSRDRKKRQKEAAEADARTGDANTNEAKKQSNRFASEFEEAIYGSESDEASGSSDVEMKETNKTHSSGKRKKGGETYIIEDEGEPLDLLDKKSLAQISSTRPEKPKSILKNGTKAKINAAGKLVFSGDDGSGHNEDDEDDEMDIAKDGEDLGAAVSAYVEAVSGKHAMQRGQRNRVKFSNKRARQEDDDEEMEEDNDDNAASGKQVRIQGKDLLGQKRKKTVKGGRVRKVKVGNGKGRR